VGILHRILSKLINVSLWQVSVIAIFLIIISSIVMRELEPDNFPRLIDALWWTMTTLVTVGYGDNYPKSDGGKIFTMLLIYTFGVGAMGVIVGKIFESFTLYRRLKEAGKLNYDGQNHYILIGSSKDKLESILEEIRISSSHGGVVVVSHSDFSPVDDQKIHFISGNPAEEEVLLKANILQAKSVVIFSDVESTHLEYADGKTLLIASRVEHLSKKHQTNIYTVVEIMKEKHLALFEHANVDEFILSNDSLSRLMAHAAIHHGSSKLFGQLLSKTEGENLYEISKKEKWITYRDAAMELFEHGATLISDGSSLDIARRHNETIPDHAKLFIICDEDTYKKIRH
jgi:voltage-gated potassium channel